MNLHNRRIIVNNDFDGCLSTSLLSKFYGCKVAGFSNSKDKLFFVDGEDFIGDELFVDMFTPNHESIDQHIPPYDFEKSCSPNKERGIYAFENYTKKYPFSTFIWLLAIASKDGYDIKEILPSKYLLGENEFRRSDILFRADDSLMNFTKYRQNCEDWANFLYEYSGKNENIRELFDFMRSQDILSVTKWKYNVDEFFSTRYNFQKEEIPNLNSEKARQFMNRFGINFHKITYEHSMEHFRTNIKSLNDFVAIQKEFGEKLFSFAFVYSPWNSEKQNFSYTLFK